jgi:hypothetical protein
MEIKILNFSNGVLLTDTEKNLKTGGRQCFADKKLDRTGNIFYNTTMKTNIQMQTKYKVIPSKFYNKWFDKLTSSIQLVLLSHLSKIEKGNFKNCKHI